MLNWEWISAFLYVLLYQQLNFFFLFCRAKHDHKSNLFINIKMPTIVVGNINFMFSWKEHDKGFITLGLSYTDSHLQTWNVTLLRNKVQYFGMNIYFFLHLIYRWNISTSKTLLQKSSADIFIKTLNIATKFVRFIWMRFRYEFLLSIM